MQIPAGGDGEVRSEVAPVWPVVLFGRERQRTEATGVDRRRDGSGTGRPPDVDGREATRPGLVSGRDGGGRRSTGEKERGRGFDVGSGL